MHRNGHHDALMNLWMALGVLVLLAVCGSAAVVSHWTSMSRSERQEVADLVPIVGKEAEHGQTESADREVG
jgi:hypothetical protein